MPASSVRWWTVGFVVATSVAFSSALRAPFVFDDHPGIRQNASIRTLLPLSVPLNPPQNTPVAGRPVVNLTLAVNHAIHTALRVDPAGPNATLGFHLGNLLIHIATGLLLFLVMRRTIPRVDDTLDADSLAGVATLLWLLHPIQTEAVDYAIQRTELLVSFFYVATLYASIRAWDAGDRNRRWWLMGGVALCALGMGSKEVMVTAPVIVVLYDLAFRADWRTLAADKARRLFYGGLVATTGIVVASVLSGSRELSVGFGLGIGALDYALTQYWAIARYLRLLAWPNALNFDYGDRAVAGLAWVPGALVVTSLLAITIFAWARPRLRWIGFAGAWFFLLLAPSSSIVPIRTEVAAERRVYLASAAVVVLVVIAIARLLRRSNLPVAVSRSLVAATALAFTAITWQRGLVYGDSETLYSDVIAKSPENSRGYFGLGLTLFARGPEHIMDAEILFRKAIDKDTMNFAAWQALGVVHLSQAHWQEALFTFQRALRIEPENLDAISGVARAHVELGDADAAMPFVDRLGPKNAPALWAIGNLLVRKGRGSEAVKYLELAAATGNPSSLGVALLSLAYAQSADVAQARRAAQVATARAGDTTDVYNLAAKAMIAAHRPQEARAYLRQALALDPTSESLRRALESLDSLQQARRGPH